MAAGREAKEEEVLMKPRTVKKVRKEDSDRYPKPVKIEEVRGPYDSVANSAWCYFNKKNTDVHAQIVVHGVMYHIILTVPVRASRAGRGR